MQSKAIKRTKKISGLKATFMFIQLYKSSRLLVFFVFFNQIICSAQTYVPFPDSNAIWRQYHHHYDSGINGLVCHEFQDYIKGDTIINGITYKNVWSKGYFGLPVVNCNMYHGHGPKLAYREINKQIFYILYPDTSEFILYDFNLNLGDTCIYPEFYGFPGNYRIITLIDSILINGTFRRRYLLSDTTLWLPPLLDSNYVAIIEGIGSTYGLLPDLMPNWQEKYDELVCFHQDGIDYMVSGSPCNYLDDSEIVPPEKKVNIYPNPAGDAIYIEDFEGVFFDFILYDLTGRIILKKDIAGRQNIKSVSLNNIGNGVYTCFINGVMGKKHISKLIIVK